MRGRHFCPGVFVPFLINMVKFIMGSMHKLLIFMFVAALLALNAGTATADSIQLPKTGQTTCYNPQGNVIPCSGTVQDGGLQDGVAWPSPRFSDNGTTLTDKLTGLIWPIDGRTDAPASCTSGKMTWQQAFDYVSCLNANNYLGYNDWRLPNVNELESLLNLGQPENGEWLQSQGFYLAQDSEYWTSTTDPSQPANAWDVDDADGCVNTVSKTNTSHLVRSVRGGQCGISGSSVCIPVTGQTQCYDASGNVISCNGTGQDGALQEGVSWPSPRFTDNGDGTVTDNLTSLIWTKDANAPGPAACSPGTTMTWQAALSYVACLNTNNYLGHNDWRLPNRREMHSIVDYSQYNPDIPTANPFVNVDPATHPSSTWQYWTSTTDAYYLSAWIVWLYSGYTGTDFTDNEQFYAWPVRLGTPVPPAIALNPASLSFSTTLGTNPANQTMALSNGGGGFLSWTATAGSTSPAWLSVSPGSGAGKATLTASVNSAGLAAGTYTNTISIAATGATNSPKTVNVTLKVINPLPTIALNPTSLNFNTVVGTNPANQTIALSNSGGGVLSWTATADTTSPAWLSVSPGSGVGNATLTVSVNATGLTAGTYSKVITITGTGASNTPQIVNVTLTVANNVVFATNAGGPQYVSQSSGVTYQADTGYSGGAVASASAGINGTSDPTLYQTERYGNFAYNIPLANGNYSVILKFAEIYWTAAGKRIFNVSMQGTQVISNLDIFAQAGKNAAYDVTIPVSVTNGTLNITFTSVVDNAKVSAILVTSGAPNPSPDTTPPTVPAGVTATAASSSQINIFWAASTDPVVTGQITSGVAGYKIYRNGAQVGTATTTNYADTGLTASTTYSYTVSAYDAAGNISAQSTAATATTQASSTSGTVVFADNSGGGQYTDTSGNVYKADTDYSGGAAASTASAITGTSDPTLYQTERYGNFAYNIPLANGNYNVTLKFAEIYWTAAGKRVFDVSMQGTQVISNLDIFAQAGKNAAYDVTIPVSVSNGTLSISFTSVIDNAKVSAIEVTSGTTGLSPDTTPPTVPAGVTATAASSSQINISWAASTDPVVTGQITSGVAGYKIYRNGAQVGTATTTNYADTGLTASTTYSYTVSAYDAAGNISAQSTAATATTQASSTSGTVVFADNAGGGQYTDTSGNVYKADTDYSGGYPASTTAAITGTVDPTLYQTERYGNFSYNIPLANGNYNVTLRFAEIYWSASGKRIFNVSMQGTQVISNLDIFAQAGKNAAYDVTIPVSVTNGTLSITFTTVADNAKVSAIEITSR